jgi:hypothetical protein
MGALLQAGQSIDAGGGGGSPGESPAGADGEGNGGAAAAPAAASSLPRLERDMSVSKWDNGESGGNGQAGMDTA